MPVMRLLQEKGLGALSSWPATRRRRERRSVSRKNPPDVGRTARRGHEDSSTYIRRRHKGKNKIDIARFV